MQNEGVGADVSGHHQPAAIHLLTQRPDVYGQRGQIATGRDKSIRQQDGAAKVQRDKTTSSWEEGKKETESTVTNSQIWTPLHSIAFCMLDLDDLSCPPINLTTGYFIHKTYNFSVCFHHSTWTSSY